MRKRIGEFLVEKGVLSEDQVQEILRHSQKTGLRFGESGMDLKILSPEKLQAVFGPSYAVDFFHLDPRYFPQVSRELLTAEQILRFGALPLGFKTEYRMFRARRILNVGLIDPKRTEVPGEVEKLANAKLGGGIAGTKVWLILVDQYLEILREAYATNVERIRSLNPSELDGTLLMYLENVAQPPRAAGGSR
jgi:hypothetical protein